MVLGVLPFIPLSAAAKEGAGDPPIRKLRYMRGVIFPSPSEGDQLLPPELGGGCHRAFLLHIHPPPINKKICLTSVNDRSTLRCTGEGTLSPLVGNPPRTALGAPNSHCSPSPSSEGPRRPTWSGAVMRRWTAGNGGVELEGEAGGSSELGPPRERGSGWGKKKKR